MILNAHDRILGAAVRVFEEHGIRGATTRRIADAAEVNEVTLFRHFGSKENLLHQALEWAAKCTGLHELPHLPDTPADPLKELTEWARIHMQVIHERRMLIRTSMAEFEENPGVTRCGTQIQVSVAKELQSYIEILQEKGMASRETHAPSATALLMGALFSDAMSRDICPERFPYTLDAAADHYVSLFAKAIGVTADKQDKSVTTRTGKGKR
jgi:AcrR family transcriptional regulator